MLRALAQNGSRRCCGKREIRTEVHTFIDNAPERCCSAVAGSRNSRTKLRRQRDGRSRPLTTRSSCLLPQARTATPFARDGSEDKFRSCFCTTSDKGGLVIGSLCACLEAKGLKPNDTISEITGSTSATAAHNQCCIAMHAACRANWLP